MDIAAHIIKFNSQTAGRDKLCRVFQYSSKFVWYQLHTLQKDKQLVEKFKILESALSSTRKVLRFGKSLDMLQGAIKSMSLKDSVLRFVLTLSKLNQAGYLLLDHLLWMGKTGLVKTDTKRIAEASARFWLITIICNLLRNLYDIFTMIRRECIRRANQKRRQTYHQEHVSAEPVHVNVEKTPEVVRRCLDEGKPVIIDTVKNVSDLMLPLSSLGYVNISPGTQGILGTLSSILGIVVVWNPLLKLSPS